MPLDHTSSQHSGSGSGRSGKAASWSGAQVAGRREKGQERNRANRQENVRKKRLAALSAENQDDIAVFPPAVSDEMDFFKPADGSIYSYDASAAEFELPGDFPVDTEMPADSGMPADVEVDDADWDSSPHFGDEISELLPPFKQILGLPCDALDEMEGTLTPPPLATLVAAISGPAGRLVQVGMDGDKAQIAKAIASAFGLAPGTFLLRDQSGCVVPISAVSGGNSYALEVPGSAAQAADAAVGDMSLRFVQEMPHGAAVWLHTKLTKKGEVAGSCAKHVFSPAPQVALSGGDSADNRAAALAKATVTAYDASGAEVEGVVHVGTAQIVEKDGECFISWPEMGLLDTSRRAVGMPDKQQKLSAKELQGNRGATGWFTLKVAVPGCAELWLLDGKGERAKIVIKNERNAALGWEKNSEGPYGDHSRCVPSHIAPDGRRLCRHGAGSAPLGLPLPTGACAHC